MRAKINIKVCLAMIIGLAAIYSSWWSVQPSSEYRYQQMLEQHALDPDSVSNDEWLMSNDDDKVFVTLGLVFGGVIAFFLLTLVTLFTALSMNVTMPTLGYALSVVWFLLGGMLHAFVWLI